jgi:hypothetical protein
MKARKKSAKNVVGIEPVKPMTDPPVETDAKLVMAELEVINEESGEESRMTHVKNPDSKRSIKKKSKWYDSSVNPADLSNKLNESS